MTPASSDLPDRESSNQETEDVVHELRVLIQQLRQRSNELDTHNQQLQRALLGISANRDLFRHAFEVAPTGYLVLDAAGKILEANASAAGLLGLPREACVGRMLAAFVSNADQTGFAEHLRAVLGSAPRLRHSIDVRLRKVGPTGVQVRLSSFAAAQGTTLKRCLVSITDQTELCRLQESEARFSQIAAHVEDVYYQTDDSGRLVYLSSAYEHVWRRDLLRTKGERWFHAVHADDLAQVEEARRLLLKGDPFDEEYRIIRPDGEIRWVRDRAFLLDQPSQQIVGVARDITDDRDLEEELRQSQKLEALGTLASGVAHDFGNLLQGVMGCLNIALSETTPLERSRDYTRQALMAVRGGATLVGQLMKFGRKDTVRPRAISIDAVIQGSAKLLQRLLGDHIELRITSEAAGGMILADPVQIEQILMNLTANARDAMPGGGRLLIRTEVVPVSNDPAAPEQPLIRLEVRDVGCGMDRETQKRVFEPFFTTKAAGKGTGLGLSAVRAVTRDLGGQVRLESELGQGTSFIFNFPAVSASPLLPSRALVEAHFAGRALLVEDDWRVRMSVRQYLEELGFEVVEAGDAVEALSRAKGAIVLLVTDVVLPEVSGPKIRDMLKAQYPDLKALYISAHPAPYLMEHGLLKKSDLILQKPFELHDLAFRLNELCSPAGTGRSEPEAVRQMH